MWNDRVISLFGSWKMWPYCPFCFRYYRDIFKLLPTSRAWPSNSLVTIEIIPFLGLSRVRCIWVPTHWGSSTSLRIAGIYPDSGNKTKHSLGSLLFKIKPVGEAMSPNSKPISSGWKWGILPHLVQGCFSPEQFCCSGPLYWWDLYRLIIKNTDTTFQWSFYNITTVLTLGEDMGQGIV